jgi:hypothetical protein
MSMVDVARKGGMTPSAFSYAFQRGENMAKERGYRLEDRVILKGKVALPSHKAIFPRSIMNSSLNSMVGKTTRAIIGAPSEYFRTSEREYPFSVPL